MLEPYRAKIKAVVEAGGFTEHESALATWKDDLMQSEVMRIKQELGSITDLILIGIGGSSLGTEAIHEALRGEASPRLYVLDSVSDFHLNEVVNAVQRVPKEKIAVCVISKSGGTTETLSNASVLLSELGKLYHGVPYDRTVCIGNKDNQLLKTGAALGCHTIAMHEVIGGRYSVFTAVGLVPLALLGYDTEELLKGLAGTMNEHNELSCVHGASTLYLQLERGTRTVNIFAFDTRLEKMARWYRQLAAESLGKEKTKDGKDVAIGFVPTISTPVELHSIGQLYFSGFKGVYTDFLAVQDTAIKYQIHPETPFAPKVAGKSLQEIAYAIEGGVVEAYRASELPFRKTTLARLTEYELGLCMGMRMLETMYLAAIMHVDAFDQPNVELYKEKTREILGN